MNRSVGKKKARAATSVRVLRQVATEEGEEAGFEEFKTEDGVFLEVSKELSSSFRRDFSAPCYSGGLFDDIGFLGDTVAARQILEGTYEFPPDTDPATKLLFEEAAHTFAKLSNEEIATFVSVEDFQFYWKRANEHICSSYSGLHFSHYKAAAFDYDNSTLHAAKLTACARKGITLE